MSDIVKGVLAGGWSLLVGWILPTAINLVLLRFLVIPQLDDSQVTRWVRTSGSAQGLALVGAAAAIGLLLAALQTPLYRLLEGYLGWRPSAPNTKRRWLRSPLGVFLAWSRARQLHRKQVLLGRLDLIELAALERAGQLRDELRPRLEEVRTDRRLDRYRASDPALTEPQLALMRERLRRYPVGDAQVVPTRLGNAIRRLEEYGYDRYRLDSQTLWYELTAVASDDARKQVDQARTTVDFLVGTLYGNVLVAVCALAAIGSGARHPWLLATYALALMVAATSWYHIAVKATDDWAAAVRALVNLGRGPLAAALGLRMPPAIGIERKMWAAVSRLSARPYDTKTSEIDQYRDASQ